MIVFDKGVIKNGNWVINEFWDIVFLRVDFVFRIGFFILYGEGRNCWFYLSIDRFFIFCFVRFFCLER